MSGGSGIPTRQEPTTWQVQIEGYSMAYTTETSLSDCIYKRPYGFSADMLRWIDEQPRSKP